MEAGGCSLRVRPPECRCPADGTRLGGMGPVPSWCGAGHAESPGEPEFQINKDTTINIHIYLAYTYILV